MAVRYPHMRKALMMAGAISCALAIAPSAARPAKSGAARRSAPLHLLNVDYDVRNRHAPVPSPRVPLRDEAKPAMRADLREELDPDDDAKDVSFKPRLSRYHLPATHFRGPADVTVLGLGAKVRLPN